MKIRITNGKGWYRDEIGEVFEVTKRCKSDNAYYVKVWEDEENRWVTDSYYVRDGNYEVVEEPKTHVIDGKTYVEVERKANVGEKVIIVNAQDTNGNGYENGAVFTVTNHLRDYDDLVEVEDWITLFNDEYRVLEPVDQAPESLADLIANLVRRVHSLEIQLRDTQNNVERQGVEIAEVTHKAEKHATMFGIVEDNIEMVISDIVTLDERTQVLNAVNSHFKDGERR